MDGTLHERAGAARVGGTSLVEVAVEAVLLRTVRGGVDVAEAGARRLLGGRQPRDVGAREGFFAPATDGESGARDGAEGQARLGGAGLVMFGMVAATGIRILSTVDFKGNRHNLYIVALAIGVGLIPLVAPRWTQQMAHGLHPLLESGILLTAVTAVVLNLFFNGSRGDARGAVEAAKAAEAH